MVYTLSGVRLPIVPSVNKLGTGSSSRADWRNLHLSFFMKNQSHSWKMFAGKSSYDSVSQSSSTTASEKVLIPCTQSDGSSSEESNLSEIVSEDKQISNDLESLKMEHESKLEDRENLVEQSTSFSETIREEDSASSPLLDLHVVEKAEGTSDTSYVSISTESERVRKRVITPPGIGQRIYEIDSLLTNHRDHLDYRYGHYKKMREAIDKYEGGLEMFSRGYEKFGFTRSATGITYREWAPGAKWATLIGDFNSWNPNADVMTRNEFGVWEIFLPNNADGSPPIPHGSSVKIRMDTPSGIKDSIPAWIKFSVQAPGEIPYNGIYYDPPEEHKYVFKHPQPEKPKSLRIYESHIGMSSTISDDLESLKTEHESKLEDRENFVEQSTSFIETIREEHSASSPLLDRHVVEKAEGTSDTSYVSIRTESDRVRKRVITPPGIGQRIYEIDPLLTNHRDHLDYRYGHYKKMREAIDKYEGGLEMFSRGYETFGFTRSATGITYREWAPGAKWATLIGDFNNWNPNADVMTRNEFGVWEIFLPNNADGSPPIPHGSSVKIRMDTPSGIKDSIPAWIKFSVQAPGEIPYKGIYYDPPEEDKYVFKHPQPEKPKSLRIYESHIGMSSTEPIINTYANFRDEVLPRIKNLGYNAVQIMAIQEHSYYASFGYHVTNFFAPSSRFGNPDDLKSLIDRAHELGLVVLMDIVHSHASNNTLDGLNMFDGTDSCYFHSGSQGYHWMWDSRLFNYGHWEVLRFLLSNARWWLDEYKFDGFRFDGVTSMMYTHHGLQEPIINTYANFRDEVLPRIKDLGYNAVQLMAIQEHSYYASFGYHVTNFFAPSSRFGNPDDLKSLIDRAHELGLVVLMDIVHSHASNNTLDGLNMFDGTDSCYFHSGSQGYHWMWDSRLFNYGHWEVLRFLLSNARWWLDEYKFDGFRFDGVTSMMYTHHGLQVTFTGNYSEYFSFSTDVDAVVYLMLVNDLIHGLFPEAITVGEDVSGMPTFCIPVQDGGVGFDYRLHMAIADKWIEILKKRDEDWKMGDIVHTLTNRRWSEKCVAYAESHDQALVGDKTIAFWLMDKDMYDFMAIDRQSTPLIDRGIALHKMIRLITMGLGGEGYLNFMGNEFGHPEWIDFPRADQHLPDGKFVPGNNNSFDKCRRRFDLGDAENLRYRGMKEFDRAMHHLEEKYGFMTSEHQYISRKDEGDRIIVFERGNLVFVCNLHWTNSYSDYRVGCLKPGKYKVVLESDDPLFGGFSRISHDAEYFTSDGWYDGRPHSFMIYAPCRTAVVYALVEDSAVLVEE
ncbi:unnamed protein product [Fraxinus pennsylvanica]|uniref:1,4-alpha-glucan branching enzyme n=1 Tax=Fraxinus pennsylvanica TaxID=56036 RepID=A0AAD2ADM8_9LAMI|nr:unnamed protein product [Fraxinus pennsylvanica]